MYIYIFICIYVYIYIKLYVCRCRCISSCTNIGFTAIHQAIFLRIALSNTAMEHRSKREQQLFHSSGLAVRIGSDPRGKTYGKTMGKP